MEDLFGHLAAMSDERGLFEHADGAVPRPEHGYCTDDNARLLAVASMAAGELAPRLGESALRFVRSAQVPDGRCRNRMGPDGRWTDRPTTDDCWGRSLFGLGRAAAHHPSPSARRLALRSFDVGVRQRSRWPRAMAFAALGAFEVLQVHPDHHGARFVLHDAAVAIGPLPASGLWRWPEARLRYANATLAEAMIAAGSELRSEAFLEQGLEMLAWLMELETPRGHLSVTGDRGRGPGETGPQFDQQPIEVAALADASWRALVATGDDRWTRGIAVADGWFRGANDLGLVMFDPAGGGFDGLHADRVNQNQGAESTLAYVSTMQRAAQLERVA